MNWIKSTLFIALTISVANINAGSAVSRFVDFYGHPSHVTFDQQFASFSLYSLSQKDIASRLSQYRNSNLNQSIHFVKKHMENYALDDASTTIFVDKFASMATGGTNSNEQTFVKYLILKELGYDVVLTRTGKKLNCLGNLSFTPGRYIYIRYANKVYKDLDFKNRRNYSKHLIYKDPKKTYTSIKRNILAVPRINANIKQRSLSFNYGGTAHSLEALSNESITEFLGDLPMYDVGNEFTRLKMSSEMESTVMRYLKTEVKDKSTIDAAKFLLSFVQQVVPYGSDYDKYGEERFYYPEETIMSENADCEDKAMLLAYLAKNILNINSVGLFFENDEHLSLALEIPNYSPTGSFKYEGKHYVSCEPTAQYPKLGQSQFSLNRVTEVIRL
ncbi:MAG: hypothetical protein KJP21_04490 [Bacteroidia bacterium]|nr:hypothetical protein [Bacteroidia bacterium]NNJ55376.1 hypothetical protein [Bacteroidia bacterium]